MESFAVICFFAFLFFILGFTIRQDILLKKRYHCFLNDTSDTLREISQSLRLLCKK